MGGERWRRGANKNGTRGRMGRGWVERRDKRGERGGASPMGGVSGKQKRRRNEGDNMKEKIRGWEETPLRKKNGAGVNREGELRKRLCEHCMERKGGEAWERGWFIFHPDILGTWTQCCRLH